MNNFTKIPSHHMYKQDIPLETRGMYALLLCMQGKSVYCYPKIITLMRLTGYKRTKVKSMLKTLQIKGLIQRKKDHQGRHIIEVSKIADI